MMKAAVVLFTDTPKQEVDGLDLKDFDVSAIFHMNDAVLDVQDRDHVLGGILTPAPPFWLRGAVSRHRFGRSMAAMPPCLSP